MKAISYLCMGLAALFLGAFLYIAGQFVIFGVGNDVSIGRALVALIAGFSLTVCARFSWLEATEL